MNLFHYPNNSFVEKMKTTLPIALILALFTIAACSKVNNEQNKKEGKSAKEEINLQEEKSTTVTYHCQRGESIDVLFTSSAAILTRNSEQHTLAQQPTGSGFLYSNGKISIRGKGDNIILEIGRMAPLDCSAQ